MSSSYNKKFYYSKNIAKICDVARLMDFNKILLNLTGPIKL